VKIAEAQKPTSHLVRGDWSPLGYRENLENKHIYEGFLKNLDTNTVV
jgi:hypothetical protein